MAEIEVPAPLSASDRIRFADNHRPVLPADAYTATVAHVLKVDGQELLKASKPLRFVVAGPRFGLAPGEVVSSFPPHGATGDFSTVLPHVLLRRASLPWERSAVSGSTDDAPPWLALLVFADGEDFTASTVAASALIEGAQPAPAADPFFQPLTAGPDDDPNRTVSVIDLDAELAARLLPGGDDLRWLAGVREVNDANARALLVANRLPVPGKRNVVHLVSLEHQYRPVSPPPTPPAPPRLERIPPASSRKKVRLVSLAQWDFQCEMGPKRGLRELLSALSIGDLRLDPSGLGAALGPAQLGALPLEHRLASGQRSAAWYHGPLLGYANAGTVELPARRAEDLLLVEKATSMADVSYAAAWTLGRLLALRDPAVGIPLHQWKRQVAHAEQAAAAATAAGGTAAGGAALPVPPPPTLKPWFENALARLAAVPFAYLMPEPALLKPETLCLFALDPVWLAALCDGAFSMGRTSERERLADKQRQTQVLPELSGRSGMLLRSAVVSGWPDLVVDAFSATDQALPVLLRFDRLASDTLLVLFDGVVAKVDLHPHPQALHFGFDQVTPKALTKGQVNVRWSNPRLAKLRVMSAAAVAQEIGASAPHDFAQRMLESAPRFRYQVQVPDV